MLCIVLIPIFGLTFMWKMDNQLSVCEYVNRFSRFNLSFLAVWIIDAICRESDLWLFKHTKRSNGWCVHRNIWYWIIIKHRASYKDQGPNSRIHLNRSTRYLSQHKFGEKWPIPLPKCIQNRIYIYTITYARITLTNLLHHTLIVW